MTDSRGRKDRNGLSSLFFAPCFPPHRDKIRKNTIPPLIFRQSLQIVWDILEKQGRHNENGQAENKKSGAAAHRARRGAGGAALERGAPAYAVDWRAAVCAVRGADARRGARRLCPFWFGDGLRADGAWGGAERDRRHVFRRDAARRRDQKRAVCRRGPARAMCDERVRGAACHGAEVVCAHGSNSVRSGVYLCVPACGRGARHGGAPDLYRRSGADLRCLLDLWRGACPAA